ncbi:DUF2267 domain-containing protein [Halomonas sp. MCCC 1A17488]|uniref:DUF2267 domain-containing protein n=1 Tax=unclassified Halomonas TaxID=2609666 RepID=UPI0018D23C33|nr:MULTISPECIES: DUF2267 domain-containing protein [unclassified Halomonas]MCE8016595.1 DUF2267 domain-containing protein [Halomonas sp. MCCC 1A17488]MCG3239928.1 DUF2267 domain-containing protein [Halomonas sp. MCCC 1A17488]QPP50179.1 DUF2267 domain-containing protein [Halomonas sp. SS10-MC5]
MSDTGLDVFHKTLQKTHIWLDELMQERPNCSKQEAWHTLCATLRTLRDKLPADLAAHFAAQLPLLLRGAFYEQYDPAQQPMPLRSQEEFLQQVQSTPGMIERVDADTVSAVLRVVSRQVDPGLTDKLRQALSEETRSLWAA